MLDTSPAGRPDSPGARAPVETPVRPQEQGNGDTLRGRRHLRDAYKAEADTSTPMENHRGRSPDDDGSREWCRRPSSVEASARPTVNPRFSRGNASRPVSEQYENHLQFSEVVVRCECGAEMATTSHRTTSNGTLYAVECRECEATGGVRRDGETFGAVAALEDVDVEPATGGHPPAEREAPVTCAGCGRDRRLSPFVRDRDDDREVIWLCRDCAPNRGGDTDE